MIDLNKHLITLLADDDEADVINVLLVDDDEDDYMLTRELFSLVKVGHYALEWASSYEAGLEVLAEQRHHVCLVEYRLGEHNGVELIATVRNLQITTPMILLTGTGDYDLDVEAMKAGATDYLVKDETSPSRLERTIRYAVALNLERRRAQNLLQGHAQKQSAVASIGRLALTNGPLDELFTVSVSVVAQTLGVEYSSICELLPDGKDLIFRVGTGWQEKYVDGTCIVSAGKESQAGFTLLTGEPVIVEDFRKETRFTRSLLLSEHNVQSGVTVMIGGIGRHFGVLGAHTCPARKFASDDVDFLVSVANVLAEAVNRTSREEEEIARVAGLNVDINERKLIEAELEMARDAALASARLKAEFLANMSHEIRTPMNGVIGMTELLRQTELTPTQQEYTHTIEYSASALLTIIDDILDFSKIEAGLLRFETIDFELRGAVEAPVELLAARAQGNGVELASLVYRDVPTALRGDPGRLRQVLTNLIGNAVKFTERGEVVVSVSGVSETDLQATLRFEIQDTGIGISPEAQRRLFLPFTQADGSTTRKYGGTGLGLVISKQLIELMGGEIGIDSVPGSGSTFWFTATFDKQVAPAPAVVEPARNLNGARLLIVDDNAANRSILNHQASSWGMIVVEAATGEQALECLHAGVAESRPFDIAVMDLMMPDLQGFLLAEAIKADSAIASVALVLLPSFTERGHGGKAWQAGIAAYLPKPVRQSHLHDCLTQVMAQPLNVVPAVAPRLVTRHSLREFEADDKDKIFSSLRIIVAEDNLVNQKVALGQLYNLGYHATAVANGRELLKSLEIQPVDIILMDCQMPDIDGFAATAEIRRREGVERHTTIIAMTANALNGDQERCLAEGMDDYLSKPVKPGVLLEKLERWAKPPTADVEYAGAADLAEPELLPRSDVIDRVQLAGLKEIPLPGFLDELIELFFSEASQHLSTMRDAVLKNDLTEVRRVAHGIKGSAANIGATHMSDLAQQMEKVELVENLRPVLHRLESEFELVRSAFNAECNQAGLAAGDLAHLPVLATANRTTEIRLK